MKQQIILLSLVVAATSLGCGGRSLQSEESTTDAGLGGSGGTGVGGSGGSNMGGSGGTELGGSGGGLPQGGSGGVPTGGSGGSTGGTGGAGGAGGAGGVSCGLTTGSAACDTCMTDSCLTECFGCEANAECAAFVTCALGCTTGDTPCMEACLADHEGGVNEGLPLVGPGGCLRENCNGPCIASGVQCDISAGDAACDLCVAGHCMAQCTTCADNSACVKLVECALACPPDDQGCVLQCGLQNTGGITDATAFVGDGGCVEKHCSVECKGAPSQCDLLFGVPACDACVSSQCLASCNACADNPSCVELMECALACPANDQGCLGTCALQNPTGVTDATSFAGDNGCVSQKCPVECGMGSGTCGIESGNLACDACIQTECLGSCAACSEDTECMALVDCYFACPSGDTSCQLGCASSHSGAIQTAAPLIGPSGCVTSDCGFWCP